MFDKDFWTEILETVLRQKMRSIMTAFGVFWGIFMLVMLIGAGMGLNNGFVGKVMQLPTNSVYLFSGITSMPYQGIGQGRTWKVKMSDKQSFMKQFPKEISNITLLDFVNPEALPQTITHEGRTGEYKVVGITPSYLRNIPQKLVSGRYINDIDMSEKRKVCVIGDEIARNFFPDKAPLGKSLKIDNVNYMIIGVTKNTNKQIFLGVDASLGVQLPLTTELSVYNRGDEFHQMIITLNDEYSALEYQPRLEAQMKSLHKIHPDDPTAIESFNLANLLNQYKYLLIGLNILIWIVGLGTLFAGLIGISNIMMITVKERTQEIGVLRALGAMPETIIRQIMCESLVMTISAGILGLALGTFALSGMRSLLVDDGSSVFTNPYIPILPAISALIVLVLGGLFAGWIPAKRALAVKAIEALRQE